MQLKTLKKLFLICILLCFICLLLSTFIKSPVIYHIPNFDLHHNFPSCDKLFKANSSEDEILGAEKWTYSANQSLTDKQLESVVKQDCELFLKNRQYFLTTNDDQEREFPIAYSIVAFQNALQVEQLLRTIYRPWNYYCFHVDRKSHDDFFRAIEELTMCLGKTYGNIVNTKQRVDVRWGTMTVLTADLNCMKELYERYKTWKYFINLTGQEFPLKTNRELVHIFKAYNGANNLEGTYNNRNEDRVPTIKMPFPLVWYKGAVHIVVNRQYVNFIFESPKAKIILKALENRGVPDEQFFSTLNHNANLRIPGSFIGDPDEGFGPHSFLTRFKSWYGDRCLSRKMVRAICIWGVKDLPKLVEAKHLFANKFYNNFQPATLQCLEKWYYYKVERETRTGKTNIDTEYYKSLLFVKNQFKP